MLLSWIIAIASYCVILSQLLYPSLNPGSHLSEKHLLFLLIHIFYTFQIMRGESKFLSEVLKLPKKFFSHYFSCFITYSFLWEPCFNQNKLFSVSRYIWDFVCSHFFKFLCSQEYLLYSVFSQRKLFHLQTAKSIMPLEGFLQIEK